MTVRLGALLLGLFRLHAAIPRRLFPGGRAFHPLNLVIEVTYRCNLRCTFCEFLDVIEGRARTAGPVERFSTADLQRLVDGFGRGRLVTFSGGETLVRKDFPEVLAYASRRHRTHVITNGALLGPDLAARYVALAPRRWWGNGLVLVSVSLEGAAEARHDAVVQRPGSWRRTVAAVRHLVAARRARGTRFPRIALMLVVTRDTADGLVDFMALGRELGVDVVNFIAEHDLVRHAGTLTDGRATAERIRVPQPPPRGVDPERLRGQLIRCFELERDWGLEVRLTPAGLPIDEFVRHYRADRALDPGAFACGGVWSRLTVSADGRYAPGCPYVRVGDTRRQGVRDIWNGAELRAFRRAVRQDGVYPGCHGCCNLRYTGPVAYGLAGVAPGADGAGAAVAAAPATSRRALA